jgi:hypothetical protein
LDNFLFLHELAKPDSRTIPKIKKPQRRLSFSGLKINQLKNPGPTASLRLDHFPQKPMPWVEVVYGRGLS